MKMFSFFTALLMGWMSVCSASVLQKIDTSDAPKAIGAYSQAISVDLENTKQLVFACGRVPYNHITKQMVETNIEEATNQSLDNIEAILKTAGSDWQHVVRMDVFLLNFDRDWRRWNRFNRLIGSPMFNQPSTISNIYAGI